MMRRLIYSAMLTGLAACATIPASPVTQVPAYVIGAERSAFVGEPFFVDQSGYIQTERRWVGILNSPDGWEAHEVASQDFVRRELIYSGRIGHTIEVAYREFRGGFAAPAFSQSLHYDLSASNIIRFQRYEIEVLSADNQRISSRVLRDR